MLIDLKLILVYVLCTLHCLVFMLWAAILICRHLLNSGLRISQVGILKYSLIRVTTCSRIHLKSNQSQCSHAPKSPSLHPPSLLLRNTNMAELNVKRRRQIGIDISIAPRHLYPFKVSELYASSSCGQESCRETPRGL